MKRLFVCFLLLSLAFAGWADNASIPTREFFSHQQFQSMQISPDGEHVAFTFQEGTQVKLSVLNLERQQLTTAFEFGENQHVLRFFWGNNERVVMEVGEVTGNLDAFRRTPPSLYAANIDGSRREQIFDVDVASYQILSVLPDDEQNILIARYHFRDRGQPKAHLLNIYRGRLRYEASQPNYDGVRNLIADNAGQVRVALELSEGDTIDDLEIIAHVRHGDDWRRVDFDRTREQSPNLQPLGFSADNQRAYFLSNHDMAENDRLGVFRYDFNSGQIELVYRHEEVDVSGGIYGPNGEVLGVVVRATEVPERIYFDPDNEPSLFARSLSAAFAGQDASITSYTADGKTAVARVRSDISPGEFYLFDVPSRQASFLAAALPDLDPNQLVRMESVRIEARDGLELHGLLTRPSPEAKNLPLIVNVHGGPFGVTDHWGFQPEAQFFASRGYATLQVNFRGSGNRGQDFQNMGRREWGGKMQDDVTDATRWAIEQGIADPERICIYGGSYGGYAALMGVIREPDLYQCSVGYVGVFDLPWFRAGDNNDWSRQTQRDARRQREQWMSAYVGDDEEFLKEVSPVHNVDKIKAELFIVHGGNDVRVVVGHAERLREALDKIGKDYQWMLKPEEGHGFFDVDNRVEMYDAMLAFFEKHIGNGAE